MTISQQLLFLFSAFGGMNGLWLSTYFLFLKKEKRVSDYCLGGLLLMISVRVIKSVFFNFNPDLSQLFIHIGLSACMLIGPFLYLYVRSNTGASAQVKKYGLLFLLPFICIISYLMIRYPHTAHRGNWNEFVLMIYLQWGFFIFASLWHMRSILSKLFSSPKSLLSEEKWLLNIVGGVAVVWMAYITGYYTSYIVGALSFSFIFYVSILLYLYKRNQREIASDPPTKYAKSNLSETRISEIMQQLEAAMQQEQLYLDHDLSLTKLSQKLKFNSKELSQSINQSTGANYSRYVSYLRVEEAKKRLLDPSHDHLKIASIAHDSGFNSLSSFNAAFKKQVGITAKEYRKNGK